MGKDTATPPGLVGEFGSAADSERDGPENQEGARRHGNVLHMIDATVDRYATVLSRILKIDVDVLDPELYRIAGTGRFIRKVGFYVGDGCPAFRRVLETRQRMVVHNPRKAAICRDCGLRDSCGMTLAAISPILREDEVLGVMGVICSTLEQRDRMLSNHNLYLDILSHIAEILEGKASEALKRERTADMLRLLQSVLDRMDDGILLLDEGDGVFRCNAAAEKILELTAERLSRIHVRLTPKGGRIQGCLEYDLHADGSLYHVAGTEFSMQIGRCSRIFFFRDARTLHRETAELSTPARALGLSNIYGVSADIARLKSRVRRFARSSSTVLIRGESGTGKELVARALHEEGPLREGPFVAVNCAAIPEHLLESELFGYVKGAFTGASPKGRIGRFEQAHGGTLFLDEIGDMPLHLQVKLLRVMESREVTRLGSNTPVRVELRIISATNKDLEQLITAKRFREDLFYRLNVIPITTPPLRRNKEDVMAIAKEFITYYGEMFQKEIETIRPDFWAALERYGWPGNVRELQNAIEYAINMLESSGVITASLLPPDILAGEAPPPPAPVEEILDLEELERRAIVRALERFDGRRPSRETRQAAADALGISLATLYRRLARYGL